MYDCISWWWYMSWFLTTISCMTVSLDDDISWFFQWSHLWLYLLMTLIISLHDYIMISEVVVNMFMSVFVCLVLWISMIRMLSCLYHSHIYICLAISLRAAIEHVGALLWVVHSFIVYCRCILGHLKIKYRCLLDLWKSIVLDIFECRKI